MLHFKAVDYSNFTLESFNEDLQCSPYGPHPNENKKGEFLVYSTSYVDDTYTYDNIWDASNKAEKLSNGSKNLVMIFNKFGDLIVVYYCTMFFFTENLKDMNLQEIYE